MHRRDMESLASSLKRSRPFKPSAVRGTEAELDYRGAMVQWRVDCNAVFRAIEEGNPSADREKFLKACGEPSFQDNQPAGQYTREHYETMAVASANSRPDCPHGGKSAGSGHAFVGCDEGCIDTEY